MRSLKARARALCQACELGNFTMENGRTVHPRRGWTKKGRNSNYTVKFCCLPFHKYGTGTEQSKRAPCPANQYICLGIRSTSGHPKGVGSTGGPITSPPTPPLQRLSKDKLCPSVTPGPQGQAAHASYREAPHPVAGAGLERGPSQAWSRRRWGR